MNIESFMEQTEQEISRAEANLSAEKKACELAKKKYGLRQKVIRNIVWTKSLSERNVRRQSLPDIILSHDMDEKTIMAVAQVLLSDQEAVNRIKCIALHCNWNENGHSFDEDLQRKISAIHQYEFSLWEKTYERDKPLGYGATTWKVKPGHRASEYAHGIEDQITKWRKLFKTRQMNWATYRYILDTPVEQIYGCFRMMSVPREDKSSIA